MTKLVLSTGNVMSGGPSIIRKSGMTRSNKELVNSLRDNFAAAIADYATDQPQANGSVASQNGSNGPVASWTAREGHTLFVPRVDWQGGGLLDDADQYEITVKLFLLEGLPAHERVQHITEALALVSRELRIRAIDLLVMSFPGLSFEGTCEMKADRLNAEQGNLDEEIETWRVMEDLHRQGVVRQLGVAEFGSQKLQAFIQRSTIRPVVDQINLKDCCSVPAPLKKLSEEAGIELNVHTDCTNILPQGTLRELLGSGKEGAGLLADATGAGSGLQGDIIPRWVLRYTAIVRNRGVIENKGYFAGADLIDA